MTNVIGETAGRIWNQLNGNDALTVAKLKAATKTDAFTLNVAIGWLAREDKINITKKGNSIKISKK